MTEERKIFYHEPHEHCEPVVRYHFLNKIFMRTYSKVSGAFLIAILFFIACPLFAQQTPWWLSLEYGKQRFRSADYGSALILFENARRDRRAVYERMERDFINFLSLNEVRRTGDFLDKVERFAYERYYTAVTAALEELYHRIPKESFKNSANEALKAFDKLKNFPEAEYWIGEVYRVEGELFLALGQYNRALAMYEALEDPGFAVFLQYKTADIYRLRQEYNAMEAVLLAIINQFDTMWTNSNKEESSRLNEKSYEHIIRTRGVYIHGVSVPFEQASASFLRTGMTKMLNESGHDRFLEMYRYNNSIVEQAHRQLGFYYIVRGRLSASSHMMFSFLIQNTIIIEEIRKRKFDFAFTTLQALIDEINKNPLLLSYIDEVEYYKTAYYLGASLLLSGHTTSALSIWRFLSTQPQAGEWHGRAITQLRNPQVEPIIERP